MKISKIVHSHLILNKNRILDLNNNLSQSSSYIFLGNNTLFYINDSGDLSIYVFSTGKELLIPRIMYCSLKNIDFRSSPLDKLSDYENLLYILSYLANYSKGNGSDDSEVSSLIYCIEVSNLESRKFRDEIYDSLGVISKRIIISSPEFYNMY